MHFEEGHCKEGATVTLRTEMDMIFIVSNTPNPLDPAKEFPSVPVSIEVYDAPEVDLTDECVNYRPENYRAFENTCAEVKNKDLVCAKKKEIHANNSKVKIKYV